MLKTDIAFKSDINKGFLPFITAFMVFLASITFATAMIGNDLTSDWNKRMSNNITIQVLPDIKNKNPNKEIEDRIKNITLILKQTPGIKSSHAMTLNETTELLKPWLGEIGKNKLDIPLPRIITVETSDVIPLNIRALTEEIKNYSNLITIETYESWMNEFSKTISALQTLLGLIIILILSTTAITIAYATKSGLIANKNVIEIMHMVGAHNKYISKHFSNQMMELSIYGGIVGYIIACITITIIKTFAGNIDGGIISNFNFSSNIYWYILLIPLIAGIISKITAVITVNKTLNKMV